MKKNINFRKLLEKISALPAFFGLFVICQMTYIALNLPFELIHPENYFFGPLLVVWSAILGFYGAVALSRFGMQLLPLRADGKVRLFVVIVLVSFLMLIIAYSISSGKFHSHGAINDGQSLMNLGPLLLISIRQVFDKIRLQRPYILFLRRFGSYSDRSLVAAILRAAPRGIPVVFLVGNSVGFRAWDPLLIGFGGFKLVRPFQSSPIVIKAEK